MKAHTLVFIAVIFCLPLYAQVYLPNADLEEWITQTTPVIFEEPLYWSTSNRFTCSIGCGGGFSLIKTSPAQSGNFGAQLTTVPIGFAAIPYAAFMVNGEVTYDDMYMTFDFSRSGTPILSPPYFISGYYKYLPYESGDSAHISAYLTRHNSNTGGRDTLGYTEYKLGPQSSYTFFNAPIHYTAQNPNPDTLTIIFYSSDPNDPMNDAVLTLDLLDLDFSNGNNETDKDLSVEISPNPARDATYLYMQSTNKPDFKTIVITDSNGRTVMALEDINTSFYRLELSALSKGMYIIGIELSDGNSFTKKFIKI